MISFSILRVSHGVPILLPLLKTAMHLLHPILCCFAAGNAFGDGWSAREVFFEHHGRCLVSATVSLVSKSPWPSASGIGCSIDLLLPVVATETFEWDRIVLWKIAPFQIGLIEDFSR